MAAVSGILFKTTKSGDLVKEVILADKLKALDLLGKHLGMYQNNVSLSVDSSKKLNDIMEQLGGEGLEE